MTIPEIHHRNSIFYYAIFAVSLLVLCLLTPVNITVAGPNDPPPSNFNLEVIGRWTNGPNYCVRPYKEFICLGSGAKFIVSDYSNPLEPVEIGQIELPFIVEKFNIFQDHAFLINSGDGIYILDLSDPTQIEIISQIELNIVSQNIVVEDDKLYLADYQGLRIYDISNLSDPELIGKKTEYFSSEASIAIRDNYVLIISACQMYIIDVSNPARPNRRRRTLIYEDVIEMVMYKNLLIGTSYIYGFIIFDISNPLHPKELSKVRLFGDKKCLTVVDDLVYVAGEEIGLVGIDIQNPKKPEIVVEIEKDWNALSIAAHDEKLFIADYKSGLYIYDLSNLLQPELIVHHLSGNKTFDVVANEEFAIANEGQNGLVTLDITNPTAPRKISQTQLDITFSRIKLKGNLLFALHSEKPLYGLDADDMLYALDLSHPEHPQIEGSFSIKDWINDFYITDEFLIAACRDSGFKFIDYSQPDSLKVIRTFQTAAQAQLFTVYEKILITEEHNQEIAFYDFSNPDSIHYLGRCSLGSGNSVTDLVANERFVYVITRDQNLEIINYLNPTAPVLKSSFEFEGICFCLAIHNNLVFASDYFNGLHVVDTSSPEAPKRVGFYNTAGRPARLSVANNLVFLSDREGGIVIFEYVNPGAQPQVTTQQAKNITAISATLSGFVNAHEIPTTAIFKYGKIQNPDSFQCTNSSVLTGKYTESFSAELTDLLPNTTYHYLAEAENEAGKSHGEIYSFTTLAQPPLISEFSADEITDSSITLIGTINPNNRATTYIFQFGTAPDSLDDYLTSPLDTLTGTENISISQTFSELDAGTTYFFQLSMENSGGSTLSDILEITTLPLEGETFWLKSKIAQPFGIGLNYPNPFNPTTQIPVSMPEKEHVKISIFNVRGELIRTIYQGVLNAGQHSFEWNGRDESGRSVPTGMYFVQLCSMNGQKSIRKIILMK